MKKYLIIEAGSTKSDWALCKNGISLQHYQGKGINPSTLEHRLLSDAEQNLVSQTNSIYFYGAGVKNEISKGKIRSLFSSFKDLTLHIDNDIMAVVNSHAQKEEAVICILGTGSISALWKNNKLFPGTPSLGYVLSDEGGGVDIGKRILKSYFYNHMPNELKGSFVEKYPEIQLNEVISSIYKGDQPASYIASFASFLKPLEESIWKEDLLRAAFQSFIENRVLNIPNIKNLKLIFSGSIAYHYQNELKSVLNDYQLDENVINICKSPLDGLIKHHRET